MSNQHVHPIFGKILTDFWRKPIPTDAFDWSAVLDGYDGAPDAKPQPAGHGATEEAAIADLVSQLEDADDHTPTSNLDVAKTPKFAEVFCSQCGGGFGPGDQGFSDCAQHTPPMECIGKTCMSPKLCARPGVGCALV